jgi:hypothetical protein
MATLTIRHSDGPGVAEALASIVRDNGGTDITDTDGQTVAAFTSVEAAETVADPIRRAGEPGDPIISVTVEP